MRPIVNETIHTENYSQARKPAVLGRGPAGRAQPAVAQPRG